MKGGLFDITVKQHLGFAIASEIEDVPEEPGIYAWYLPLKGDSTSDLFGFLKSLRSNMEASLPATAISGEGQQRRFTLERNPPDFDFQSSHVQKLASSMTSGRVQALANTVLILSFLAEPIYVGMTES